MARLRNHDGSRRWTPMQSSVIGRSGKSALVLKQPDVSAQHASIWWDGEAWRVRDLASRNGTHVDDARLKAGDRVVLRVGASIRFGNDATWIVEDLAPPVPHATSESGRVIRADHGLLALPDPADPQVVVYREADGGWRLEQGLAALPATDGQVVTVDGERWTLELPEPTPGTQAAGAGPAALGACTLVFRVSADEEDIALTCERPEGDPVDLGVRVHHPMLLQLARLRLAEADGADPGGTEVGWTYHDVLARQLGVDDAYLHVLVFRARRQLAAAGITGAAELVERRPASRRLRLGGVAVRVEPL